MGDRREQGYNERTQICSRESSTQALQPFSFSLLAGSQHINSSHFVSYSWLNGGEPSAAILLE